MPKLKDSVTLQTKNFINERKAKPKTPDLN
jgi:hypothetical protein